MRFDGIAVGNTDAGTLLPAVLERPQAGVHQPGRLQVGTANTEYSTFLPHGRLARVESGLRGYRTRYPRIAVRLRAKQEAPQHPLHHYHRYHRSIITILSPNRPYCPLTATDMR